MFFQINGLTVQNLQKATGDEKLITVDIIANHLTEDLDGETVLKEAFNSDTVQEFLDIGVIEFWHESKNPLLTKEEKNSALIGKPIGFRWEKGLPVVTAQLTKEHPLVKSMYPHLNANNPVYAASIGGSKMVMVAKDQDGKEHKIIPKIKWDHLAIAPCNAVINREAGFNVRMLQKAQDIMVEFDTISSFKTMSGQVFSRETELRKALGAPESVGDMYSTSGGVITKQSMEKSVSSITSFSEKEALKLMQTMFAIKNGDIPMDEEGYFRHFKNNAEFAEKSYRLFDKYFKN